MNTIKIHKGDSSIFADCKKFLTFQLNTDLDLTGWKAEFVLGYITKTIDDITTKSFEVVLSAKETSQLRYGLQHGAVVLTDNEGNIKTLVNTISFEVTSAVVDNSYQLIDLTIPESSGLDIILKVGTEYVTSVNDMKGDVTLEIPSVEGLATEQALQEGLEGKQDKGNYALKSELPTVPTLISEFENDSNYATQTQVMQAIAAIPQFSISIVEALPETGEKMVLYLVSKGTESPDVYDEYIWLEQTSSFEFLGTTAVDLTDYVKKTDYASDTAGVIKISGNHGWTKANGYLQVLTYSAAKLVSMPNVTVISKGTLENRLTQYSKTVSTTQADYDALETKDANTLYLIEEE